MTSPSLFSAIRAASRAFRAQLDLTDRSRNAGGAAVRRLVPIETRGEEEITPAHKQMQALAAARDMERNSPEMVTILHALCTFAVGPEGKLFFRGSWEGAPGVDPALAKWHAEAERWFADWTRHADFLDGSTWRECLHLAVRTLATGGSFVALFDDGALSGGAGTGKFVFFEPDQIASLAVPDFAPWAAKGYTQHEGIVFDRLGRRAGVVVSSKHGPGDRRLSDGAFVLLCDPADPDAASWRFVSRKFRFRQMRGLADAVAALIPILDAHETMNRVRVSVKHAASLNYAFTLDPDARGRRDPYDALPSADELDEAAAAAEKAQAEQDSAERAVRDQARKTNLSDFPEFVRGDAAGAAVVLAKGDDVKQLPNAHPNLNYLEYVRDEVDRAARVFGIPHTLVHKADLNYSASRAEIALAQAHFRDLQQFLEDAFSDWAARRAIEWAVKTGALSAPPSADWARSLAWQYPRMPYLDPKKEADAAVARYKAGEDLEDLGFRPEEMMASKARDKALAEKYGVADVLSFFERTPGAAAPAAPSDPDNLSGEGGSRRDDDWEPVDENEAREALDEFDNEEGENGK